MINRYARTEMNQIWSDQNKFENFLKVELAATKAFVNAGVVPNDDYLKIKENAKINLERLYELESETKHDVIAFTRMIDESLGKEKKWIHYGLTSTDVVDSANGLTLKQANKILTNDLNIFLDTLKKKALQYENVPIMGRTHGMHAEITSFGLKYALWYDELFRDIERFKIACKDVEACKLSGAVGNYITTSIDIEQAVSNILGLNRAKISTQVLSRDRHANYIFSLALIASLLEKIATEIRLLSKQEIHEVEEGFTKGQKGSSAMPHKRNPIGCENICGCARVMKSYVSVALENNILWDERDISHSSAERIIFTDATTLLDYMLNRFNKIVDNLVVFEDKMLANINLLNGVIFSGAVLNKLVEKGYVRENAYDIIQKLAFISLNEKISFKKLILDNNLLNEQEAEEIFAINRYLKNVNAIYKSVGIKEN